ncbi:MAG TPA: hypothetical protein VK168_22190 [Saprospiraceae bacterium]|nr:hypothetical protein [Saprospiraceae bacterium]
MKRTLTFKSILVTASLLSLCAFAFVNMRSNSSASSSLPSLSIAPRQVETEEAEENRDLSVPDVSVLGRVYGIAKRLMDKAN